MESGDANIHTRKPDPAAPHFCEQADQGLVSHLYVTELTAGAVMCDGAVSDQ